jgi:hypothetical protein
MNLYWMMLGQSLQANAQFRQFRWFGGLVLVSSLGLGWLMMESAGNKAAAYSMAFSVGFVVLLWMLAFLGLAGSQLGRPAQTCLVPGVRRRLRTALSGLWILFTLAVGSLYGFAEGHVWMGILIAGLMMSFAIEAAGEQPLLFALWLAWPLIDLAALSAPYLSIPLSILVPVHAWTAITRFVGNGGDRHFAIADRCARTSRYIWSGNSKSIVPRSLAAHVVRGPSKRLAIGLDLYLSPARYIRTGSILAGTMAAFTMIDAHVYDLGGFANSAVIGAAMVALIGIRANSGEILAKLANTATEQQLLWLAPAIRHGTAGNKDLFHVLLEQWLYPWAIWMAVFWPVLVILGADGAAMRSLAAINMASLIFMPRLFSEDLGRLTGPPPSGRGILTAGLMLVFAVLVPVIERGVLPNGGLAIGAAAGIAGIVLTWRAWRQRVHGAPMLPVGSLNS